eukprot:GDKI01014701.1.p1 GENE.GDKI01014701.1~~GDKI01014701.1.p1  ORF type:complete len:279 (-),score=46.41 GDKI01014701.1:302-1138(-)
MQLKMTSEAESRVTTSSRVTSFGTRVSSAQDPDSTIRSTYSHSNRSVVASLCDTTVLKASVRGAQVHDNLLQKSVAEQVIQHQKEAQRQQEGPQPRTAFSLSTAALRSTTATNMTPSTRLGSNTGSPLNGLLPVAVSNTPGSSSERKTGKAPPSSSLADEVLMRSGLLYLPQTASLKDLRPRPTLLPVGKLGNGRGMAHRGKLLHTLMDAYRGSSEQPAMYAAGNVFRSSAGMGRGGGGIGSGGHMSMDRTDGWRVSVGALHGKQVVGGTMHIHRGKG